MYHGSQKMNNKYMQHLLLSMEKCMDTVKRQMGKTDIEPPDYDKKVSKWHSNLLEKISEKEPEYYVRSVNIYENGLFDINHIEYVYFEDDQKISATSINLFDIDEDIQEA